MLRSIQRNIARNRMKISGIDRVNRRRVWDANAKPKKKGEEPGAYRSYFAMNWRKYLDPTTPQYKWYEQALSRKKKPVRRIIRV